MRINKLIHKNNSIYLAKQIKKATDALTTVIPLHTSVTLCLNHIA